MSSTIFTFTYRVASGATQSFRWFPDLVLVRPPEIVFAELKTETGRVSVEQQAWLADLEHVAQHFGDDFDVYLWRPSDWDEINDRLARGRHKMETAA